MWSPPVEHDFFRIEKESLSPAPPPPHHHHHRRKTFKNIQRVVSKLNPEVLKSVIASATVDRHFLPPGASNPTAVPVLPTLIAFEDSFFAAFGKKSDFSVAEICAKQAVFAPMTIFYNGSVTVFDVTPHQAKNILLVAQQGFSKIRIDSEPSPEPDYLLERLKGVPMARRKSLEHFMEKRKERRRGTSSPYGCPFPSDKSAFAPQLARI